MSETRYTLTRYTLREMFEIVNDLPKVKSAKYTVAPWRVVIPVRAERREPGFRAWLIAKDPYGVGRDEGLPIDLTLTDFRRNRESLDWLVENLTSQASVALDARIVNEGGLAPRESYS